MNKQTGAIVVSILFAVGIAGCSSAPGTSEPGSTPKVAADGATVTPSQGSNPKVGEGSNVAPSSGIPPRLVTGELLKVDGINYTVKDQSGKEVRFQIDPSRTMMNTQPKVGDKIRVNVEPQGYAYSVDRAD
jgi:outer membrane lipoprotein SlyB